MSFVLMAYLSIPLDDSGYFEFWLLLHLQPIVLCLSRFLLKIRLWFPVATFLTSQLWKGKLLGTKVGSKELSC